MVDELCGRNYESVYLYGSVPVLHVSQCCYACMLSNVYTYSKAGSTLVNSTIARDGTLPGEITLGRTCGKLTVGHDSVFADYVCTKVSGFVLKTSTVSWLRKDHMKMEQQCKGQRGEVA